MLHPYAPRMLYLLKADFCCAVPGASRSIDREMKPDLTLTHRGTTAPRGNATALAAAAMYVAAAVYAAAAGDSTVAEGQFR